MARSILLPLAAALLAIAVGCASEDASPTPTQAGTPTSMPSPTAASSPPATPTPPAAVTPSPVTPAAPSTPIATATEAMRPAAPFVMRPGDEVTLEHDLRVRFIGVTNDSRCPVDVLCIWAGEATVQLALVEGSTSTLLEITMPAGGVASSTFGVHTIEASALLPVPRSTTPIAPADYEVTLVIR